MSKFYNEYLKRKQINNNKIYLFKNGKFFICLEEDAERVSEELELKITMFNKDIKKCGFPKEQLKKYLKFLNLLKIDYELVYLGEAKVIEELSQLNINNMSNKETKEKLRYFQNILIGDESN
ncbi:MAG: hypothetical protein PHS45_00370 [Bacilli bacterium]|jgi:hypothetical protein|nr:hypothetical protein [Bacilli bacterium]